MYTVCVVFYVQSTPDRVFGERGTAFGERGKDISPAMDRGRDDIHNFNDGGRGRRERDRAPVLRE